MIAGVLASARQRIFGRDIYIANAYNAPNAGTHGQGGLQTFRADVAIGRYKLVKRGAGQTLAGYDGVAGHGEVIAVHEAIAISASDADDCIGVTCDEADAAGDPVAVFVFGASTGTCLVVATGAISIDGYVTTNGDGTVKAAASSKFTVGRLLTASQATGDIVEMIPLKDTAAKV